MTIPAFHLTRQHTGIAEQHDVPRVDILSNTVNYRLGDTAEPLHIVDAYCNTAFGNRVVFIHRDTVKDTGVGRTMTRCCWRLTVATEVEIRRLGGGGG